MATLTLSNGKTFEVSNESHGGNIVLYTTLLSDALDLWENLTPESTAMFKIDYDGNEAQFVGGVPGGMNISAYNESGEFRADYGIREKTPEEIMQEQLAVLWAERSAKKK